MRHVCGAGDGGSNGGDGSGREPSDDGSSRASADEDNRSRSGDSDSGGAAFDGDDGDGAGCYGGSGGDSSSDDDEGHGRRGLPGDSSDSAREEGGAWTCGGMSGSESGASEGCPSAEGGGSAGPGGDFDDNYLRRFESWGDPGGPLDAAHREIFAFLAVVSCGAGMSTLHATAMLQYCHGLGGKGSLLPLTIDGCWAVVKAYHRAQTSKRASKKHELAIPNDVRELMAGGVAAAATHVSFQCEDIVQQLVGIMRSPSWAPGQVALGYEASPVYGDYCHGERMLRAQRQVGWEHGVLACTVFIDALAIDKGGFISDTGCHVTLANVRRRYRHDNTAKAPLCVMPSVDVTPSFRKRAPYTRFKRALLQWALQKIFEPANEFNKRGGMILRVPGGAYVHFKRFLLLNLSADSPQAMQVAMTGSACWECEAPASVFGDDVIIAARRSPATNDAQREAFRLIINSGARDGSIPAAREDAAARGVELLLLSGLRTPEGMDPCWNLYGPSLTRDHVFGGLYAGRLHLFDEGLAVIVLKTGLKMCVRSWEKKNPLPRDATDKRRETYAGVMRNYAHGQVDAAVMQIARERSRCSNVELEGIGPFLHFNHGLTEFIHKDRRLNATRYVPGVRLLMVALRSSPLLSGREKKEYFRVCELLFEVQQSLSRPLSKERWRDVQSLFVEFRLAVLALHRPLSKSKGKHVKIHMIEHVVEATAQLGYWADEKRDENALAQFFKKQASRTNGRESRVEQTAAVACRLKRLEDVCGWHGIAESLRITWRAHPHAETGAFDIHDPDAVMLGAGEECDAATMRTWAPEAFGMMLHQRVPGHGDFVYSKSVKLNIRNHAKEANEDDSHVPVTLRNYRAFHGHPWVDVIKYACEGDGGRDELHFGRCVCFARDPAGVHHMGLQIYTFERGAALEDGTMEPLRLSEVKKAASYTLMPISSLHSGALVIKDPNRNDGLHVAILAPREARELRHVNGWA